MSRNPIYGSITAEIECTIEAGTLYVRSYVYTRPYVEVIRGKWEPFEITAKAAIANHKAAKTRWERTGSEGDHKKVFYWGCISHCLNNVKPSAWLSDRKSDRIAAEMDRLIGEHAAALIAEEEDRPCWRTSDTLRVTEVAG